MNTDLINIGIRAKEASYVLASLGTAKKNEALTAMHKAFYSNSGRVAAANAKDILA